MNGLPERRTFGLGAEAIGGYGFAITDQGITLSGMVGDGALSVDYSQGEDRRRCVDIVQHGAAFGISARF